MAGISLNHLNKPQQEAVITTDKPVLLLAGAGSGKTGVITYRIANLIANEGIPPQWILALTFTNKAAKEMASRVSELLGSSAKGITVTTFHSLCVRILREYIHLLGYTKDFVIFDTTSQQQCLRTIMDEEGLDTSGSNLKGIFFEMMKLKGDGKSPEELMQEKANPHAMMIGKLYKRYNELLKSCNALDFEDILYNVLFLIQQFPTELEELGKKYHYIMVDEYQDTNRVQYKIVTYLAAFRQKLCVVGDDDQSIYGWRGADIRNILDFQKDFPNAEVVRLEQNYRSTSVILNAANSVIKQNTNRMPKTLWTDVETGEQLRWICEPTGQEEMEEVIHQMKLYKMRSQKGWGNFAVLYRTNFQSRAVEEALREESIPYQLIGGTRFFDRKEIQDCLSYMKFLLNPNDEVSLFRILNYPRRGIGNSTIQVLGEAKKEARVSLFTIMEQAEQHTDLSPRAYNSVLSFVELMQEFLEKLNHAPFYEVFKELFERLGLKQEIEKAEKQEDVRERKVNNLLEFINTLYLYGERKEGATLADFLEYVSLFTDSDDLDENADKVSLLTVHSSKGLEFDFVSIIGLEENQFPNPKAVLENALEEERRLFYVAITRAKRMLTLSMAKERRYFGDTIRNQPSRFIEEVDPKLFERPPFGEASVQQVKKQVENKRADFFSRFKDKE